MKYFLKRILLLIALLMGAMFSLAAQSVQLVVTLNSGEEMSFTLVEEDWAYFEDNTKLAIVQNPSGNTEITKIALADIRKIVCHEVEGTSENTNLSVSLFPNPAHDLLTLRNLQGKQMVCIYALDGRMVKSFIASGDQPTDISDLRKGIYLVTTPTQTLKMIKL